jgi:carboxypeptidase D
MKHSAGLLALLCTASVFLLVAPVFSSNLDVVPFSDRFPVEISIDSPFDVEALGRMGVDIDAVGERYVRAYVNESDEARIELLGYPVKRIPNQALRMFRELSRKEALGEYHNYNELTSELQQIVADHPSITRLISIGQTVQGRELWFLKITDNPDVQEDEPEFKYISTMHGDEPVGTENCLNLINMITDNYDSPTPDSSLERLVDEIEIWIMPMMNPDGNTSGSRYNAHGVDLNRDFPDYFYDPVNTPDGREPETAAVMVFSDSMAFDLSANFHTGALVVNYPWDNQSTRTPDDDLFINMSEAYSVHNIPMWNSPYFYHGVTHGWDWYEVHGSMQDWNYQWMYNKEVTIELNDVKWPPESQLDDLWDDNDESMVAYMEYCLRGVRGVVTDSTTGLPLDAIVSVTEAAWDDRTDPDVGDYHRILDPGTYTMTFSSPGYNSRQFNSVVVAADSATRLDVQLSPLQPATVTGTVSASAGGPLLARVEAYYHVGGELADSTTTNPVDGSYALSLMETDYDIKAYGTGYASEWEYVDAIGDTTVDFILEPISGSILVVDDDSGSRVLSKGPTAQEITLIVDNTRGPANDIAGDLELIGYEAEVQTAGSTDPETWMEYAMIVWSSGWNNSPVSSSAHRDNLIDYINAGGKLLIEGGEIAYDAASTPGYPDFATTVLHINDWSGDNVGDLVLRGAQSSHPVATTPNGLPSSIPVDYSGWGSQDAATPSGGAIAVYGTDDHPEDAGVLIYDDDTDSLNAQIAFYAFCYSDISSPSVAMDLLENTISHLLYDATEAGAIDVAETIVGAIDGVFPNPFNPKATISYSIPKRQEVRIDLYDIQGRLIRNLISGEIEAGRHSTSWDSRDHHGREVPSGIYFLRLKTEGSVSVQKMVKLD